MNAVAVALMARNEEDVIDECILHHLSQVDHIFFMDNGSRDKTLERVRELSSAHRDRITILDDWIRHFDQGLFFTSVAGVARELGYHWLVPIDADEFWMSSNGLRSDLENVNADVVQIVLSNYIQSFSYDDSDVWKSVKYKISPTRATATAEQVALGERSVLEYKWTPKYIIRLSEPVIVDIGAHHLMFPQKTDPVSVLSSEIFEIKHLPIRSYDHLVLKSEHGERLRQAKHAPEIGWEAQRWADIKKQGSLYEEWNFSCEKNGLLYRRDGSFIELEKDDWMNRFSK